MFMLKCFVTTEVYSRFWFKLGLFCASFADRVFVHYVINIGILWIYSKYIQCIFFFYFLCIFCVLWLTHPSILPLCLPGKTFLTQSLDSPTQMLNIKTQNRRPLSLCWPSLVMCYTSAVRCLQGSKILVWPEKYSLT